MVLHDQKYNLKQKKKEYLKNNKNSNYTLNMSKNKNVFKTNFLQLEK